tara:strand:- start:706 stop:1086 length:381 start_codon:yes stop_codon:yes gene_type:complete
MAKEDYLLQLSMLEQEAKKLHENMQVIDQQVQELEVLKASLSNLDDKKEILANLGRGIFIKSQIQEKELFVNVGSGIVLKKSPEDTQKIIEKQVLQLQEIKKELADNIEQINIQVQELVVKAQKER